MFYICSMANSTDLFHRISALTLASRLRRLSDKLMQGVAQVYEEHHLNFEPRWFPVFFLLGDGMPLSITELAQHLELTHPAINQVAEQLLAHDLVIAERGTDKRKRILSLSEKGQELYDKLKPLWSNIEQANRAFLQEADGDLLAVLDQLESALKRKDMYQRVMEIHSTNGLRIRNFEQSDLEDFKSLNYEWLNRYLKIEQLDIDILSNPDTYILKDGGAIFMAEWEGEIVGTCAIIKYNPTTFEIAKLGVTEKMQGRKIGRRLMETAIDEAKKRGAKEVFLETNPILEKAQQLYKSFGFETAEAEYHKSNYIRPTITMKLAL